MQQIAYSIHNKNNVSLRLVSGARRNIVFLYKNRFAFFNQPLNYIHRKYLAATNRNDAELIASFPLGFKRCQT